MVMMIDFSDVLRATLPVRSGNEGWIGVSSTGDRYHVVVPVDTQIARGVMACNLPTDGTPFGGYKGWLYFRCPPYADESPDDHAERLERASQTAGELVRWLGSYQIEAAVVQRELQEEALTSSRRGSTSQAAQVECTACGQKWLSLGTFLKDPRVGFDRYVAHTPDFSRGGYVFLHDCGAEIRLAARRFARSLRCRPSMIGSHACPGSCYHERTLRICQASCEGAVYRKIANGLRKLGHGTWTGGCSEGESGK